MLTKDLRIFEGEDPKRILLVDNSSINFVNQIDNGVPVVSYYGFDPADTELRSLGRYLVGIARKNDLRKLNR